MFPNLPIPVERVVTPPKTDSIQKEDEKAAQKLEETKKSPPKESFDTHLHRVLPPGWAPTPGGGTDMTGFISPQSLLIGGFKKPIWLQKALGDLPLDETFGVDSKQVVLQVPQLAPTYQAHELLPAVQEGVPIHEAHFPHLFVAQAVQMQQQGQPISKLMVQIAPEHLGQLNMTFTLQQQTVTVAVLAANQQAKDMLERQLGAIQNVLAAHQFKPGELKVEVAQQSGGTGGQSFSDEGAAAYQTPNRWLVKRNSDLDEEIDVSL